MSAVDGWALVRDSCRVQVHAANGRGVMAEGVVIAYSRTPQVCVRADDGSQSWWGTDLRIDVVATGVPIPPAPAAGSPARQLDPADAVAVAVCELRGHSRSAHRLLGFCAKCPGRTVEQEVVGWRLLATRLTPDDAAALP